MIKLDKPAKNGIHNIALDFVLDQVNVNPLDLFSQLINGDIGVEI